MITLLTGPNTYAISRSLHEATKHFEGDVERYDGSELEARHLPDIFTGISLFSPKRLIVLRDISANKPLWSELEKWVEHIGEDTTVYLVESNPDKRTKTYKLLQKHATIHEHKPLADHELAAWLRQEGSRHGTDLSPDLIKYLITYVGKDQWRLQNELEKLSLASVPVTKQLIQDIVEPYPEATAFELLDAVFRRDTDTVDRLVTLLSGREDPYQFFGLLSSQALGVLALSVGEGRRPADIASDIGLHPYVVTKLAPIAKQLGRLRVEKLVEDLAYCDVRIKTSGVNPWQQVRLTLLSICAA